jgi:peptide deformylase
MGKKYVLAIINDEERLSTRCDEINVAENQQSVRRIIKDLKDTIKANKDLVALSAPQLGYNARIFCIRFADEDIRAFINPMITKVEGKCLMIENMPGLDTDYMVQRSQRVMAGYQLATGNYNELSLKHPLAALFEKMIDIIDGTLFFKYKMMGLPIDKDYYKAPVEQKEELHKWYFDTFLPARLKALEEVAEKDEDIKNLQTQIKYFKSVIEGETEVVPAYGEELDFEHSSKKIAEEEEELRTKYLESIKDKYGVK